MSYPKLIYLGHIVLDDKTTPRIWDLVSPRLKEYKGRGYPTLTIEGLKERGLIQ